MDFPSTTNFTLGHSLIIKAGRNHLFRTGLEKTTDETNDPFDPLFWEHEVSTTVTKNNRRSCFIYWSFYEFEILF